MRRTRRASCLLPIAFCLLYAFPVRALDIKLWPLIDYHRPASGESWLHLFGPLFAYASGPEGDELTLRPLFSFRRGAGAMQNQFTFLYPIFVSRWEPAQTEYRLLGLISYVSEPVLADQDQAWDTKFTIFPLVFYRHNQTTGTQLSVLPFYADVHDIFGYTRVHMIAFPFYLHLENSLAQRTWLPFPIVSWSGGPLGHGAGVFPLYGWNQEGDTNRSEYILWPFYAAAERHFTRPERERRLVLFPFYGSLDSATKQNRSYLVSALTHTIDLEERTETWGFPWPLALSQRSVDSGERTTFRIFPFYGDSRAGNLHAHFIMWPLYRWSTQEVPADPSQGSGAYERSRSDVFLVLYRNIEEVQPESNHRRTLRTLFPLFRASEEDGAGEFSTLALLDALVPRNPTVQTLYAPLWQLYTRQQAPDGPPPRWSLLWDLISSDGARIRYPIYLSVAD